MASKRLTSVVLVLVIVLGLGHLFFDVATAESCLGKGPRVRRCVDEAKSENPSRDRLRRLCCRLLKGLSDEKVAPCVCDTLKAFELSDVSFAYDQILLACGKSPYFYTCL